MHTVIQKQEELRVCLEEAERVRDMERTEKESLRSSLRAATNAGKTLEEVDMHTCTCIHVYGHCREFHTLHLY